MPENDKEVSLSKEVALGLMYEAIDKADAMDKEVYGHNTLMSSHIVKIKHFADIARRKE